MDLIKAPIETAGPIESIGEGIWVAEGGAVPFFGLRLGTRMTIIRLGDGSLWLHSPVAASERLISAVKELGPVSAIVAPNKYHHMFLQAWIDAHPQALVYAAPGLIAKRPDVHFDQELGDHMPAWTNVMDQLVFRGGRLFDEVIFFRRASRTVILTDLIVNVRLDAQPLLGRIFGRIEGVAWPNGSTPLLYRITMRDRSVGRLAVHHLLA